MRDKFVVTALLVALVSVCDASVVSAAPPGAPTNFQATVDGSTVSLSWGAPTTGAAPTSYTLIARTAAGAPLGTFNMGLATSFATAAPNGSFSVSVVAVNSFGTGPESAVRTFSVPSVPAPPGPPLGLGVSVSGSTVTFSWAPPASGGAPSSYVLLAGLSPGFASPIASVPTSATGLTVAGVPAGVFYVRVVARNAGGISTDSTEVSLTVGGGVPGAPTLNAPVVTAGPTVSLSWAPGAGGAPTSYTLNVSSATGVPLLSVPLSGTSAAFPGAPSGTYLLTLVAQNASGASAPSSQVTLVVPGAGTGGGGGGTGSFPAALSGVWQNTLASAGTFTNTLTGIQFSMTQGYSAQFKVQPNGEFYFAHYSSGVSSTCSFVSFFDQMTGLAEFSNGRLTLRPRERRLDVSNCGGPNSGSSQRPLTPVTFDAVVSDYPTSLDTTLQMELSNGPYPLALKLLNRPPPTNVQAPAQPPQFQLGPWPYYPELLGNWAVYESDFYNPQTGATLFRDCCGDGRFLRILADGYEAGFTFARANIEGVCKRDIIYFERGTANFLKTDERGSDTSQGDVRFTPTEARLFVRIRECGREDGTTSYTVTPQPRYHRWSYTPAITGSPEEFLIGCQYPQGYWGFAFCYNASPWISLQRRSQLDPAPHRAGHDLTGPSGREPIEEPLVSAERALAAPGAVRLRRAGLEPAGAPGERLEPAYLDEASRGAVGALAGGRRAPVRNQRPHDDDPAPENPHGFIARDGSGLAASARRRLLWWPSLSSYS